MEGIRDLLDMNLHQTINVMKGISVIRVPGGWIYESFNEAIGGVYQSSTCFVPEPKNEIEYAPDAVPRVKL